MLDCDEAQELAWLLVRVEDWLRHAGHDAREDLAGFLDGPGHGRLAAAGLLDLLGGHAAALHRQLKGTIR